MRISREQALEYVTELQALRNERLDFSLAQEVELGALIADIMNSLEVFYVIHRTKMEQDATDDEVNS